MSNRTLSSMDEHPLLSIQNLSIKRGERTVVQNANLDIRAGKGPFAIVGESGSGKTSLLLCSIGLLSPKTGEVFVQGKRIKSLPWKERARRTGLVFQDYQLFPHLNVRENIELAPRLADAPGYSERTDELLESLRISSLAFRRPHELSGGQRQRVAIARSLVLEPGILFLDEPSAALDEKTSVELAELLKELNHRVQIIVVSHDRLFVEACCDRGIRMEKGAVGPILPVSSLFEP